MFVQDEINYRFVATAYFNEDEGVWYPQVMEYMNDQFLTGHQWQYPCQEEELAQIVAEVFRAERVAMTEEAISRILKNLYAHWGDTARGIVDLSP